MDAQAIFREEALTLLKWGERHGNSDITIAIHYLIVLLKIIFIMSSGYLTGHVSKIHSVSSICWNYYFSPNITILILKISDYCKLSWKLFASWISTYLDPWRYLFCLRKIPNIYLVNFKKQSYIKMQQE